MILCVLFGALIDMVTLNFSCSSLQNLPTVLLWKKIAACKFKIVLGWVTNEKTLILE